MSENYKTILHISGIRHQLIDDLYFFRTQKLFIKDEIIIGNDNFLNFKDYDKYDIILFHFIDKLNIQKIIEIIKMYNNKKLGLYLHTFFPFCDDGTFLSKIFTNNPIHVEFIKNIDFVITQDSYSYNFVSSYYTNSNLLNTKIVQIKQGLWEDEIKGNKIDNSRFTIGFVGSFSNIKGFDFLKKILVKYSQYFEKHSIDFVLFNLETPGKEIGEYKTKTLRKNIKIIFNEHDRTKIFGQINCLAIPSIWNETGPMVLYEAFANKVPVIVSDQESLKEKVIDRVDSYVFKTGNEKDLLKGILRMKQNYEKVILNEQGFKYNTMENFNKQLNEFLNEQ